RLPIVSLLSRLRSAPDAIVTSLESLSAEPPARLRAPALIRVGPVKVLAPVSRSVPVPTLVSPPVPAITPSNSLELAVPAVRLLAPSWIWLPATPNRSLTVWLLPGPNRIRVAPALARLRKPAEAIELPGPSTKVPA